MKARRHCWLLLHMWVQAGGVGGCLCLVLSTDMIGPELVSSVILFGDGPVSLMVLVVAYIDPYWRV